MAAQQTVPTDSNEAPIEVGDRFLAQLWVHSPVGGHHVEEFTGTIVRIDGVAIYVRYDGEDGVALLPSAPKYLTMDPNETDAESV